MNNEYRCDFPLLRDSHLIYLDNAATTQKPIQVLDAVRHYYETENANPLRGIYDLSVAATNSYEAAREKTAEFIHAKSAKEIVFTRNATEAINLVAYSYGRSQLQRGDEVVISIMEHHSNLIPWQQVCKEKGAILKYLYCDETGNLDDDKIMETITNRTKLVAITQVSNVLGQEIDVKKIVKVAHKKGAVVLVDGSQSVPHMPVSVTDLDCDFLAFSGHKMLAPMGIGVLYGKEALLEAMPPFLTGGEMIDSVSEKEAVFTELPHKFEAGTVNCGGAIGLAAAISYLNQVGFSYIREKETALMEQMVSAMRSMPEITIVGAKEKFSHLDLVSFTIADVHPHDAASILNESKIAIRAGHHCAQPLLKHLNISSCLRASVYFYNTEAEVDQFLQALTKVRGWMGYGSKTGVQ